MKYVEAKETTLKLPRFQVVLVLGISLAMLYVLAMLAGVAPASAAQRDWISDVRTSELAQEPRVRAALRAIDSSPYLSRDDFELVARAVVRGK